MMAAATDLSGCVRMVGEEVSDLVGFGRPEALEDAERCRPLRAGGSRVLHGRGDAATPMQCSCFCQAVADLPGECQRQLVAAARVLVRPCA